MVPFVGSADRLWDRWIVRGIQVTQARFYVRVVLDPSDHSGWIFWYHDDQSDHFAWIFLYRDDQSDQFAWIFLYRDDQDTSSHMFS